MQFRRIFKRRGGRIYLDYAAATPVHVDVMAAMEPYFGKTFGNPSAVHAEGVAAKRAINDARKNLAHILHVREEGVIFTGSGTEANNLAIRGVIEAYVRSGRDPKSIEVITTAIEHPSVLESIEYLKHAGVQVTICGVLEDGRIDFLHLKELLGKKTVLIACTYVNSEIGVIEDVKKLTRLVRKHNDEHNTEILVHLDAAQAPLWLPCQLDMLGVDLMSLDGGKCYGPKGIGVLVLRHGVTLLPVILGGGQEDGLRAGTENTPLIVGCAEALQRAQDSWQSRSETVASLRDHMISRIETEIPESVLNGSREHRVANNVNISIPGIDGEFAVITLDSHGIAASTRSACGGAKGSGSDVVREISNDEDRAYTTIRFSLGEETKRAELEVAVHVLREHVMKTKEFLESTGS